MVMLTFLPKLSACHGSAIDNVNTYPHVPDKEAKYGGVAQESKSLSTLNY